MDEYQSKQRKKAYTEWMRRKRKSNGQPYSENTINSYISALSTSPARLSGVQLSTTDVFEVEDPEVYRKLKEAMLEADNFEEINEKAGNRALQYSIVYYEDFLRDVQNGFNDSKEVQTSPETGTNTLHHASSSSLPEVSFLDPNIILYGPPGTGKTYHTVIYAVAMIERKSLHEIELDARHNGYESVKKRYDDYKAAGQIVFTTFHQSYGYEEFMEGIKPVMTDAEAGQGVSGDVSYKIESGIFKKFCETAIAPLVKTDNDYGIRQNPVIWKVSLGGAGDNPIKRDCFANGRIRIGWDGYGETIDDTASYTEGGKGVLNAFMNEIRIGDLVLVLGDREHIDAIGVVTGEYEWLDQITEYKRSRNVKWLVTGIAENIVKLNGGAALTLSSVYRLNRIGLEDVLAILSKHSGSSLDSVARENPNNYVFIIDEVNRGNISKIFGELITLIEPSKRLGMTEEIRLQLPYSGELFGVPNNVYLLATMNTADRSIARLDTALRRRFAFAEMMPDPTLLSSIRLTDADVNLELMLETINRRIEALYDREHMLGHAYFLSLKNNPTLAKLGQLFEHAVIPLLQEYFYDDYEKIRLVLGDHRKTDDQDRFITKKTVNANELFGSSGDRYVDERRTYRINAEAFGRESAYRGIYENKAAANGPVQS